MIDKKQFALGLRFNLSFNADNDNNAILDALYEYKEKKKKRQNPISYKLLRFRPSLFFFNPLNINKLDKD